MVHVGGNREAEKNIPFLNRIGLKKGYRGERRRKKSKGEGRLGPSGGNHAYSGKQRGYVRGGKGTHWRPPLGEPVQRVENWEGEPP